METLSGSAWGIVVLWIIGVGLLAYAVWRERRAAVASMDLRDWEGQSSE